MASEPGVDPKQIRAVVLAAGWSLVGLLGSSLLAAPFLLAVLLLTDSLSVTAEYSLQLVASGAGMVILAGVYLQYYDLDVEYLDVKLPSLRDLGYSVLGFVFLMGGLVVVSLLTQALGIQTAEHSVSGIVEESGSAEIYLVLAPLSFLVIAPAEELFYRNIIQKSLYDWFNRRNAVLIASALFALIHIPAYFTQGIRPLLATLPVLFVLALVLGESYRRTRNLTVPILIHAVFNAIQFLLQYYVEVNDIAPAGVALVS
ncbi:Abortive infection protein [Halorhabdus utahensis DSM 12940]|uniref:Abortive infection protein n=1 Tax=Halorhabdus utahensis (strain DSM 12940 / JCM 11049 / AX-2) TaxID=519442 RepID=C7NQB9_HALUD|nr:type II CAAX endopeptidase family protein [Halorhabdus utahensis]ACV12845.1 Abortive infection protein [Halorhabdus utahensis DSM 12940]